MSLASIGFLVPALLAAGSQEPPDVRSHTIPKQDRSTYIPVLERYRTADEALRSNALECSSRCTELIDDKGIKEEYRETRVRLQNTDGSYGEWTLFAPFQLRGRAWMALARAAAGRDRREAAEHSRKAAADFKVSVDRGMRSSGAYLEQAQDLVSGLKETVPAPDPRLAEAKARIEEIHALKDKAKPEEVLRLCAESVGILEGTVHKPRLDLIRSNTLQAGWTAHANAGRFRSASGFLKTHGGFRTEKERRDAETEIEKRCAEEIATAVERFQTRLRETGQAWDTLARLPAADFDRSFALPEAGELVVADPALEACRRCRDRLVGARAVADPLALPLPEFLNLLSDVARTAVEAAPLVALVFDLARMRLEKAVKGAEDASSGELRVRREEVQKVVGAIAHFAGWPDGAAFRRQQREIEALQGLLPEDCARIDEIGRELLDPANPKGIWGNSPQSALQLENELRDLPVKSLTRESRQKRGTYLVVAAASRLLLSGETVDQIVQGESLLDAGRRLDKDGGPLPDVMGRVSPKIRAVAERLKP